MSVSEQVPVVKPTGRRQFGMLPADVIASRELTASAKLVLLVMNMESYGSGSVAISDAAISLKSGVSRTQVLACRGQIESAGYIRKDGTPVKQVQPYCLLHPRMASTGAPVPEPVRAGSLKRELVKCPKCRKKTYLLLKAGWCRSCQRDLGVRRLAREEIAAARTA